MDTLSSCYFCGTALDEPVGAYQLITRAGAVGETGSEAIEGEATKRDAGTAESVVLCSTCRRKLEPILERVLAAAAAGEVCHVGDSGGPTGESDGLVTVAGEPGQSPPARVDSTGAETDTNADDLPVESDDEDTGTGASGETDDLRNTISALEYNKVIRLLQNREFPVNRDEIESVAANAYGLARSDCANVIDQAIDRDLIDEEAGQLHRPE